MPVTPFVLPSALTFYLHDVTSGDGVTTGQGQAIRVAVVMVYNPYPFDILFKVDNAHATKYSVSLKQGLVSSQQKIALEVGCETTVPNKQDAIAIRFFKWGIVKQGQRPKVQHYVGYRTITVRVFYDRSDDPEWGGMLEGRSLEGDRERSGDSVARAGDVGEEEGLQDEEVEQKRTHVTSNLIGVVLLLLFGLILNKANEAWFSQHVMDGVRPQTLAVMAYTLAFVVFMKLLTLR